LKKPKLWVPYLFLFYPSVVGLVFGFTLPDSVILKALSLILPFMFFVNFKFVSLLLLSIFELHVIRNLIAMLTSFIRALTVIALSKKT